MKTMRAVFVSLAFGAAIVASAFCGGQPEAVQPAQAAQPVTLSVLAADSIKPLAGSPLVPVWDRVEAKYLQEHPNVKLQYEMMPTTEVFTKFVLLVKQGNPPDIVHLHDVLIYPYAKAGFLGDLTPYMSKSELEDFTDFANSLKYEGKVYTIPVSTEVRIRVINKAHFRAAGLDPNSPPKTWEEILATGGRLTHVAGPDQYAYGIIAGPNLHTPMMWMPLVWMAGGSLLAPDGKADFTNDAVYRAAGFYHDLIHKHQFMPKTVLGMDGAGLDRAFLAGQLSEAVMGSWRYGKLASQGFKAEDLGWAPMPYPAGGKSASFGGSWNWSISAATKHAETAYGYIRAMNADEFIIAEGQYNSRIPVRKSIAKNPSYPTDAAHKAIIEYSLAAGRWGLSTPNPIGFLTAMMKALQAYWSGSATAEEAFTTQENEYNKSVQ